MMEISEIVEIVIYLFLILFFAIQVNWKDPKTYKVSALILAGIGLGVWLLSIILG
jgi:hypothetical protein